MPRIVYILSLLALLTFLVVTPTYAYVPPAYMPLGPGDTYLALGDSLATGTEAAGNNDNLGGYPDGIYAQLLAHNPHLHYVNLGRSGETSTSMLLRNGSEPSQLEQAIQFIQAERAAGRRVGLVTLDIGGNDIFGNLPLLLSGASMESEATLETFAGNLRLILDQLLAAMTVDGVRQGDLLIMNYYYPYPGLAESLGIAGVSDAWIARFNGVIQSEAEQRGIPVAEVAQAFAGNEVAYIYVRHPYSLFVLDPIAAFDFHPRPAGHQAIAAAFLAVSGYQ